MIIGDGPRAQSLASSAQELGATLVQLRAPPVRPNGALPAVSGDAAGAPRAVPIECSAAVFASLQHVDGTAFETIAILAAGLCPLKPSYLDGLKATSRGPPAQRYHEWTVADAHGGGGGGNGAPGVSALLTLAWCPVSSSTCTSPDRTPLLTIYRSTKAAFEWVNIWQNEY